jgi:sporulation protein YqfC
MKKPKDIERHLPVALCPNLPIIEIAGNREISVEGCTGVLKYEKDNIKINTKAMIISISGRSLQLKFLSSSSLIIEGTVLSLEFIM